MPDAIDTQLAVLGAGPGGYAAAFLAADKGMQVTLIDAAPKPGGVCLHHGCIPSKALLQSSENYEHASHAFAEHGIEVKGLALNLKQMLARKNKVVR